MMLDFRSLLRRLYSEQIGKDEFVKLYFKDRDYSDNYCSNLLQKCIEERNADLVEEAVALISAEACKKVSLVNYLCDLIQQDWHFKHEDIADFLKTAKDPSSVDCLFNVAEKQFEYLNYDDTFQFGRKCIKALYAIGDKNAMNKLLILSKSNIEEISFYAKKELERIEK